MIVIHNIFKLSLQKQLYPCVLLAHTQTCPTRHVKPKQPVCPSKNSNPPPSGSSLTLKRALKPGKVRMGFIPEEWFLFFHSKTGVSGPYIFGIVLANYLVSKEIYVMEHEYYTGLSVFLIIYYASTRFGPELAKFLDKQIDEIQQTAENERKDQISFYENEIKMAKDAQWRAQGQKLLMDAKKEHIAMQLEAIYRERYMHVFRTVKSRLDYHVKLQKAYSRIQQKWMVDWIIQNVMKAITPEFEQQVLKKAIQDISEIAGRT